jgi:hypothetical protein
MLPCCTVSTVENLNCKKQIIMPKKVGSGIGPGFCLYSNLVSNTDPVSDLDPVSSSNFVSSSNPVSSPNPVSDLDPVVDSDPVSDLDPDPGKIFRT